MTRTDRVLSSAVEAIGNTPLVELARLTKGMDGRILAKMEYLNPGLSKKDRIARQIIEEAEAQGALRPGQTVVELTSGNTGTGLAIVCAVKGYPFVAVMSRGNSMKRARMMSALDAEVVLVDQLPGSKPGQVSGGDLELVERATRKIVLERDAFRADQFTLQGNRRAHYLNTAREIIRQTGGAFHAFCDFAGTGGSFAGCAAGFKEHDPSIRCFLVEPEGAAVLAGQQVTNPNHRIQGGGYSMTTCPCSKLKMSTATCRSARLRLSRPPAGWPNRKEFSRASPPAPMWRRRSSFSRRNAGETRSSFFSATPVSSI